MSDIFISYAREDRPRAQIFAEALQKQGWSIWWDRNILSGKTFDEVIEKELDAAKCVIVLWSKNSIKSDWVKDEAAEGKEREILVPVLIDDVTIPLGFRRIQTSPLADWNGTPDSPEYLKLLDSITEILASPVEKTIYDKSEPGIRSLQGKMESNDKWLKKKIFLYSTALLLIILVFLGIKFGPAIFKQDKKKDNHKIPPTEYVVDVYADQPVVTRINVEGGDILNFEALGTWSWGSGPTEHCSPDGTPGRPSEAEYPVTLNETGVYFGTLIGRIEENPPFKIGTQRSYRVQENQRGRLILLMNDRIGSYADNAGSIQVTIKIQRDRFALIKEVWTLERNDHKDTITDITEDQLLALDFIDYISPERAKIRIISRKQPPNEKDIIFFKRSPREVKIYETMLVITLHASSPKEAVLDVKMK